MSLLSSAFSPFSDRLKPYRAEALQRIKVNGFSFVATLALSYLLPLPSFTTALLTVFSRQAHPKFLSEWWLQWICISELAALTLFLCNILQASYAINYPPAPTPSVTSPARGKISVATTPTPNRPFRPISPTSNPQPQKPFAFTPNASFTAASLSMSAGGAYAPSPVSTPSRVLHYSPLTSSTTTLSSSTSTADYLASPSPVVSAFRGKRAAGDVGRALDASLLRSWRREEEDAEED